MAYIGVSPSNGVRRVHTYTATASQTTFSGAGAEGTTLSYKDSNFVDVYQNGIKLGDADYTSTSGTSIVLAQGASVDDLVVVMVFDVFSVADTVSKADGGTFDGNVTMAGTLAVTGNGTVGGTLGVTGATTLTGALTVNNPIQILNGSNVNTASTDADDLIIEGPDDCGLSILSATTARIFFGDASDNDVGSIRYVHSDNSMRFEANAAERMRINSSGYFHVSQDISDSEFYNVTHTNSFSHSNTQPVLFLENSGDGNVYGLGIDFSDSTPDNNTSYFMVCQDATAVRLNIWSDGDIQNHDNSYGALSDEKLKEQIADASSQWEDIKSLKVRKFKMKEDVAKGDSDDHWRLGVVAQEVETAGMKGLVKDNPELVTNSDGELEESGTTTKVVKYSILYMKAVKALQEAMTRIETLETENKTQATQIADLISRVTALENAE